MDNLNYPKLFSIKTSPDSGIGDQLGTQFATLYTLGSLLGYRYVHIIPMTFLRSYRLTITDRILIPIEKIIRRGLGVSLYNNPAQKITSFLGLEELDNDINGLPLAKFKEIDVDINSILQEINDLSMLQNKIEKKVESSLLEQPPIHLFSWSQEMYDKYNKVNEFLQETGGKGVTLLRSNHFFSEKYWAARESRKISLPFDKRQNILKITVHIRLGDSTAVEVNGKKIYVHGSKVFSSLEEFSAILEIDPTRQPTPDIDTYISILDDIFSKFGADKFCCAVISDGYAETFSTIRKACRDGRISLSKKEIKELYKVERDLNQKLKLSFSKYKNTFTILGESNLNLFKSIHALACSDIVIHGTGGFALNMHQLLKKINTKTILINHRSYGTEIVESIGLMLNQLH